MDVNGSAVVPSQIRGSGRLVTLGHHLRRWATLTRAGVLARLNGSVIDFDVHPTVQFGPGCTFPTYRGTRSRVVIGAGTTVGEHVQLNLRGGSATIGARTQVRRFVTANLEGDLEVGDEVLLSVGVFLHCREGIVVGDRTIIGEYSTIADSAHQRTPAGTPVQAHVTSQPVSIGRNIWIGTKVVIPAGVVIGDHAFVGGNSVVTTDVAPWTLVAGVPAREIRQLSPDDVT